ncbi:biotin--[acetyl-CoA-carboxylase] ligase [Fundidesulfovibrio terrae]|uniref:biotin--[acetyl-CoA-carboxylase] ligase n=1 Tax=Fundidesulfovibrio terrae TaxID=2922866 RepID=UPI001FAFB3B9
MTELQGPRIPGPGVLLWAQGREELADPLFPEKLADCHPGWAEDARAFAPWQEVLVPWCSACAQESWWLSSEKVRGRIVVCGPCSSCLDVARPMAENKLLDPWDSVLAVSQWSGRGQLRRGWDSPPGNLYAALVLPQPPREYDSLLPLILGYCMAGFLLGRKVPARIKWPNDILAGGVKVGGMLVEERRGTVLAGIGLNLVSSPPLAMLREDHAVPAGYLKACGLNATPLGLWRDLVDFVKICYETTLTQGTPHNVTSLIEPHLEWLGQDVLVREGGETPWRARIIGLAPDGALRVKPAGVAGERLLTSGSIWRAPEGPLKNPG